MIYRLYILILICYSCGIKTYAQYGHYEIEYSVCPVYPDVEHYRMVGKQFNPEECNFVIR